MKNEKNKLPLFKGKKIILKDETVTFPCHEDDKKEICLLIEKEADNYYFKIKDMKNRNYIGTKIKNKKNLDIYVKSRNDNLVKYLVKATNLDPKTLHDLLEDIGEYLTNNPLFSEQDYELKSFDNNWPYLEFDDYPGDVKNEALNIIKEGNFLEECLDIISITHEGNKDAATLILLSFASLFLNDPVHQLLGGKSGGGKTDLCIVASSIIPDRYVHKLRGSSPKYIFYACEKFNDDHNIIINDDFQLSSDTIELNKTLTDNKDKIKVHNTVINGKAESFQLKGNYLSIINLAKELKDNELLNRLFLNDIKDKDNHENKVKKKIKSNKITEIDNNKLLEEIKLHIKAVFQYHIDKHVKIFNPYTEFLDIFKIDNRNIGHLISFIKAKTFYSYSDRKTINGITIGTKEDLKSVLELWKSKELIQEFKLSHVQEEILKNIFPYIDGYAESIKNVPLFDSEIRMIDNISNLATKISISYTRVSQAINGTKDSTHPSLKDLNLIRTVNVDPNNPRKGKIIFLNPEYTERVNALKNGFDNNIFNKNLNEYIFDTVDSKKKLLNQFLSINNININNIIKNKRDDFIKEENYEINSYEILCEFLEKFIDTLENIDLNVNNDYKTIKKNFNILK